MANIDGVHDNFFLATKVNMRFADLNKDSTDLKTLSEVVTRVKIVLETLNKLDNGCTKLRGKYLMTLCRIQDRLMKSKYKMAILKLGGQHEEQGGLDLGLIKPQQNQENELKESKKSKIEDVEQMAAARELTKGFFMAAKLQSSFYI